MGFINLLKNGYRGKLGETVGQKWKNQLTVRTYQSTNNSKSDAQAEQREFYKESITKASEFYPTSRNLVLPPRTNMNKFNFITSLMTKVLDGTYVFTPPDPFMGLKTRGILHPFAFFINGKCYIYINDPRGEIKKSLKSFSLHILFSFNYRGLAAVPFEGLEPVSIYDKSLIATINGFVMEKGFAVELTQPSIQAEVVLAYLTVKKGNQRIFTKPANITPLVDLTNENWTDN